MDYKWIFLVKLNPDGSVAKLKGILVVKDYAQTYEIDYFDTFSLVAKFTFVHLFISIAASQTWSLH